MDIDANRNSDALGLVKTDGDRSPSGTKRARAMSPEANSEGKVHRQKSDAQSHRVFKNVLSGKEFLTSLLHPVGECLCMAAPHQGQTAD